MSSFMTFLIAALVLLLLGARAESTEVGVGAAVSAGHRDGDALDVNDGLSDTANFAVVGRLQYVAAATCCPGCSYYSSCCCAPLRGPQSTVTRTSWATKTVTSGGRVRRRRQDVSEAETDFINEVEPQAIEEEARLVDRAVLFPRQRHLCPVCPPGVDVSPQPSSGGSAIKQGSGAQYCCPGQRPATKIVTRTITRTATRKPGPGAQATHVGRVWQDNNEDGKYTPGIDDPIVGKWIIIRFGTTIVGRALTDANGSYLLITKVYSRSKLFVSVSVSPTFKIPGKQVVTGADGNSKALIPIPPPKVNLTVFSDMDANGNKSSGETNIGNATIIIKFSNGTVWKRVKVGPDGKLAFSYRERMPNATLMLETADGSIKLQATTDANGNLVKLVPIPMKGTTTTISRTRTDKATTTKRATTAIPSLSGNVCRDMNNDSACTYGTDSPVANQTVIILFPNGTVYANATLLPNGTFVIPPSVNPAPNTNFTIVINNSTLGTVQTDGSGGGKTIVPLKRPVIVVRVFLDNDKSLNFTPGDTLLSGEAAFILLPNGTAALQRMRRRQTARPGIYGNVTTGAGGLARFLPTIPAPSTALSAVLAGSPTQIRVTNGTDWIGNGWLDIPIPPGVSGSIYYETGGGSTKNATEKPYANAPIVIRFPNGTIFANVTTGSSGEFTVPGNAGPNQQLVITSSNGTVLGELTTDSYGGTRGEVIPYKVATINGFVCRDPGADGKCDASDPPLANATIVIKFPNGTVFTTVTSNSSGHFEFFGPAYPNQTFTIEGPIGAPALNMTTDSTGAGHVVVPVQQSTISGSVFWDMDKGGNRTAGDVPESGAYLEIRFPNGTVYANITTSPNGTFSLQPGLLLSNTNFSLVWVKDPGVGNDEVVLKNFTTGAIGNAYIEVPLKPAVIEGVVFYDVGQFTGQNSSNEPLKNGSTISLVWPNGTVFATVPVNASGYFSYPTVPPRPNETFSVVLRPGGTPVTNFTTDGSGQVTITAPVPPPVITVSSFHHYYNNSGSGNSTFDDGVDLTTPNRTLEVFVSTPSGNVSLGVMVTNANGTATLVVSPSKMPINGTVYVVDPVTGTSMVVPVNEWGQGSTSFPLPPPKPSISGTICRDMNRDGNCSSNFSGATDLAVTNGTVQLAFPNGTVYATATILPNGTFAFPLGDGERTPNTTFSIVFNNKTVGSVTTDVRGDAVTVVPVDPPAISVQVFLDNDSSSNLTGSDTNLANEPILLLFPNGTVFANVTTGANGTVVFYPSTLVPNVVLTAVLARDPSKVVVSVTTDSMGNAQVDVPVPTGISGSVFYDRNSDSVRNSTEAGYANQTIEIRFKNGTFFANVTTGPSGNFSVNTGNPANPGPTEELVIVATDGTVLGSFVTDSYGGAQNVEMPYKVSAIDGYVCSDPGADGKCDSSDPPLANATVVIKFPNGTIFTTLSSNSSGHFEFFGPAYPNQTFIIEGPIGAPALNITTDSTGAGHVVVPVQPSYISGSVFWDMDNGGNRTAGDVPESGAYLEIRFPNGTVYANVTTSPNGTFSLQPGLLQPNANFSLVWVKDPGVGSDEILLANFTTGAIGNAYIEAPLKPAVIEGVAFYDFDLSGTQNATDPPLNGSTISLIWPNGTVWATVPVNSSGYFSYPTVPIPDESFSVVLKPGGTPIANFTTNSSGNVFVSAPIPPPVITVTAFFDYFNNKTFDEGTDVKIPNRTLEVFVSTPNGNVSLGVMVTNANGTATLVVSPDKMPLNGTVYVVDPVINTSMVIPVNEFGQGTAELPIPAPKPSITGTVCLDMDRDGNCTFSGSDLPAKNQTVYLRFKNGTIYSQATLLPSGTFQFPAGTRAPNTTFDIVLNNSTVGSLQTDVRGDAVAVVPLDPPAISLQVFLDNDASSNKTTGDTLLANETVLLLFPNGTVYANVTTGANGSILFYPSALAENTVLTAVLASDPSKVLASTITNWKGDAQVDVPVPTSISGFAFYDANSDLSKTTGEYPYANTSIQLRFKNGTLFATVTTGSSGQFLLNSSSPGPYQELEIVTMDGKVLANFTTNAYGGAARVEAPVPIARASGASMTVGNSSTCAFQPVDVVAGSLLVPGTSPRAVEIDLLPGTIYKSGSAKGPSGWTMEYSTDGGKTWNSTEPTPASLVNSIRASSPGNLSAGPLINTTGNTEQMFTSDSLAVMTSASIQRGASGGDSWGIIFAESINKFFVYFHHAPFVAIDCRDLLTGLTCPGYDPTQWSTNTSAPSRSRFAGYITSHFSNGFFDSGETRLYLAVTNHLRANGSAQVLYTWPSYGYIGMLCFNVAVSPPVMCSPSWYQVGKDLLPMVTGVADFMGPGMGRPWYNNNKGLWMELLKRYYTIDAYNWKLECFDVTTKSSCSGFPYKLNGSAPLMAADVDNEPSTKADIVKITDTKFYVQTDRNLYCFDAASGPLQLCSSGWPIAENSTLIAGRLGSNLQFSTPAYPYENPIGDVKGVCTYVSCFDFAGQIHDEWGASAYFKSKFNWTVAVKYLRGNARYPTTLGRSYLYGGCMINGQPTPVNCFDHYTNTTCSGFTPPNIPDPCAYGLYVHPSNPACLLYIADSGVLGTIDAYTGASGCLSSTSKESDVTDKGASTCSGRAPLSRRYSLEALAVNKGNVSGLLLTVLGSNGQPVVNWTGINVTVGKPIDMSSLSMALTGYTAQFKMTMVAPINGTPEVPFRMTYYAPGPELCLTVIPTINETMRIPILAQTINKGDNTTITAYNTTIDSHPC